MNLQEFVQENEGFIKRYIKDPTADQEEMELWVENNEFLYTLFQSQK